MNSMPDVNPLWAYGPTVILLGLILTFILKALPTWKEVRLRELELRGEENTIKTQQAAALATLGNALTSISDVLKSIAVEQRRSVEIIEILQRANNDTSDRLDQHVRLLAEWVKQIEDGGGTTLAQIAVDVHKLTGRLDAIEGQKPNVESESAKA